jgi:hypothetical protein
VTSRVPFEVTHTRSLPLAVLFILLDAQGRY